MVRDVPILCATSRTDQFFGLSVAYILEPDSYSSGIDWLMIEMERTYTPCAALSSPWMLTPGYLRLLTSCVIWGKSSRLELPDPQRCVMGKIFAVTLTYLIPPTEEVSLRIQSHRLVPRPPTT